MGDQYSCFWFQNALDTVSVDLCSNFRINCSQRIVKNIKICFCIDCSCQTDTGSLAPRKSHTLIRVHRTLKINSVRDLTEVVRWTLTLVSNKCLIPVRKNLKIWYQTSCFCHFVVPFFVILSPDQNIFSYGSFKNPCFLRRYWNIARQLLASSMVFSFIKKYIQECWFSWSNRSFKDFESQSGNFEKGSTDLNRLVQDRKMRYLGPDWTRMKSFGKSRTDSHW